MYYLSTLPPVEGYGTTLFIIAGGIFILLTAAAAIAGIVFLIIWLTKKR